MRCGFAIGRRRRSGTVVSITAIAGLSGNPTYGTSAYHQVELTASFDGASTWQWQERDDPADATPANISGATSATFTPNIGTNITDTYQIRAVPDGNADNASNWYTVRYAPATIDTAASISGTEETGENLTGTPATFTASGGSAANLWEVSDDGVTWTSTGDTDTTSPALADLKYYRFSTTYTNSGGSVTSTSASTGQIVYAAPTVDTAATASGDPVIGENLTGTFAVFTASGGSQTDRWEVSDTGSGGWTDTGDSDTTGPTMVSGKYYRTFSSYTNSGGTQTSASSAIGPAVAPVLTLNGLTTDTSLAIDIAEIGDEASITFTPDQGTVTAREWGSFENGSNMGTGSNPTSMAAFNGGTLWAEATIGGVQYRDTAPIYYPHPTLGSSLINQSFAKDNGVQTYATASGFTFSGTRAYEIVSAPTGVTVNSSGQVSFDTDVLEAQSLTNITVRMKDAVNEARYVDASFSLTITDSSIVLSNYSENLAANPPTFSFDVTAAGNGETYFWEFHNTSTPPGRGNGFHASGSEGTVSTGSNSKQPDLRAEFGNTGYLHHSVGASGASNVLTSAQFTVPTSPPAAFADGAWSVADADEGGKLTVTFTAGPTTYGTSVTDVEYEIDNSGTWVSTGLSSFPGSFDITGLTNGVEYDVVIRAISSDGNGDESSVKAQTPTAGVPSAFSAGQWTVADEGSGGTITFNLSALPANNGASISAVQYTTDAGSNWNSIGGTSLSTDYDITVQSDNSTPLSDDTEYTVAIRAVNSAGNGTASGNKTVTPTTAAGTTPPTFIGADSDGINSASSTTDVNAPSWAAGDEVFVFCDWSCGVNVLGTVTITDLSNGDTINTVISPTGTGDGNGGHSAALYRFRATGSGGGVNAIRIAHSGNTTSIQGLPFVVRGADATNPVAHASSATANGASPAAPAMVVTNENCLVIHCVAAQFDMADDSTPTGYTLQESHDVGALGAVLYTRNTETSASESVASESYTLPGAQDWVAISFVVQPDGV